MRAFAWFLGSMVLAGLIGACVAYPAYELTLSFAHFAFHRVASRIFMLTLAALLVWLCRHLNLKRRRDFGYGLPWRRFLKVSLLWAALGIATASIGAAFLLSTGLRLVAPDFVPSAVSFARIFLVAVGSGIAVALVEETVFRGVLHTAIERESGPWMAAALTAPLFAVLHFTAKARIGAEDLGWGSGFELLLLSFAPLGHPAQVADALLSWLVVGLTLSLTRVLTGNIAVAIGLHAGWVVVLRMLQEATVSGGVSAYSAWVTHFDGLLGYWLLPWGAAIAAALWFMRGTWVSYAKGLSTSSR
jgi:membrane protease YdiL (CAAX protease family)